MTNLFIFIFGFLFATILMPVLDSIGTLIQNWFGLRSVFLQKQAEMICEDEEEAPVHAVGFQIDSEEMNNNEEEEYDG